MASRSRTSPGPAAPRSSPRPRAVPAAAVPSTSKHRMEAPSAASRSPQARPIPDPAPVTNAVAPSNLPFTTAVDPGRHWSQELEVPADLPVGHAVSEPLELPPTRGGEDPDEFGAEVLLGRTAGLERGQGRLEGHRDGPNGRVARRVPL